MPHNTKASCSVLEMMRHRYKPIPIGIRLEFQFKILSHPNSGIGRFTIPISNPEAQYLHPNGVLRDFLLLIMFFLLTSNRI